MIYEDMARDAGYSGEEAQQMAQALEQQAQEDYYRHLGEQAAADARYQEIGAAIEFLRSEGLLAGTKEEVAAALAREDGVKLWLCGQTGNTTRYQDCQDTKWHQWNRYDCGWYLLIPLGETPQ